MKKKEKIVYYVHYVVGCSPALKVFKTLEKAKAFFDKVNSRATEDDWSDFIIKGTLVQTDPYYLENL